MFHLVGGNKTNLAQKSAFPQPAFRKKLTVADLLW
jgi:hypothetical protein